MRGWRICAATGRDARSDRAPRGSWRPPPRPRSSAPPRAAAGARGACSAAWASTSGIARSIPEIMGLMEQVNDSSIALPQRFELASQAMAKLTGIFLSEALAPVADAKRSVILSRLSIHLKATIDTLSRKKEVKASDTFNPSSPKFQACLSWLVGILLEAVKAEVEPITSNIVINHFATAVVDWEEKFVAALEGS